MCGRFVQDADAQELQLRFEIDRIARLDEGRRRYNIAPTNEAAVVRLDAEGRRELTMLRWGLVPAWKKDGARPPINARAEGSAERNEGIEKNRYFAPAFRSRRCLVPARGFYEWGPGKQPWRFERRDGGLLALAGLWEWNEKLAEEPLETFAVITVAANPLAATVHDRMPAILPPEAWAAWLDPHAEPAAVKALLAPFSADQMQAVPVSKGVNDARNERPDLLEPAGEVVRVAQGS